MPGRPQLPIDVVLPDVVEHLEAPGANAVVLAPPGAGKTTALPLALLAAHGRRDPDGELFVAQPRRLAARMAASLAARFAGVPLGGPVGYRVRYDSRAGDETRLCYLTDGLLLRRLRSAPDLPGVHTVVLDEFHERKLDGDLTLALLRRAQRTTRPDLRIVVMSATLDPGPVAEYLDARTFESQGRAFPVELDYQPLRDRPLEAGVLRALTACVDAAAEAGAVDVSGLGHVLVFLPGASEIRRCHEALRGLCRHHDLQLMTLHGELDPARQDEAVAPSSRPKVILSTNVAETSVTIDDVAVVIDSGLARVSRHDPWTGFARLELGSISRASADQRAGRAGRTRPGRCIRLYARADFERRPARQDPELLRAELSGALFELAAAGAGDPRTFPWFEAPHADALESAAALLRGLDAVGSDHRLTATGRAMRRWPLHPRLARVMAEAANEEELGRLAAGVCAVISERDLRRSDRPAPRPDDADPLFELDLLGQRGSPSGVDPRAAQAVSRARRALEASLRGRGANTPGRQSKRGRSRGRLETRAQLRRLLSRAFFDKVARVRPRDGRLEAQSLDASAIPLAPGCVVREDPWMVVLQIRARKEGTRRRSEVTSACAVELDWILEDRIDDIDETRRAVFDASRKAVFIHEELRLGALVLESQRLEPGPADAEATSDCLFEAACAAGLASFCDLEALESLRARLAFAREAGFDCGALEEELVLETLRELCDGRSRLGQLREARLLDHLRGRLGDGLRTLDRVAPTRIQLPGGRRLEVGYEPGRDPFVASFLQDFFGSTDGPRVADGRVPLVLHLRAPNRRDVQVTTDLAGFWERHYPELRRQLSRRYPKHDWPEDPVHASPPAPRRGRGGRRRK